MVNAISQSAIIAMPQPERYVHECILAANVKKKPTRNMYNKV